MGPRVVERACPWDALRDEDRDGDYAGFVAWETWAEARNWNALGLEELNIAERIDLYAMCRDAASTKPVHIEREVERTSRLLDILSEWETGRPIGTAECPCCGAALEVEHGDDIGTIAVVGTPAEPDPPPVVPRGYTVTDASDGRWALWLEELSDQHALMEQHGDGVIPGDSYACRENRGLWDDEIPLAAIRALLWAIEHDQRPPHAGDAQEGER
jgi:hypothetical protein